MFGHGPASIRSSQQHPTDPPAEDKKDKKDKKGDDKKDKKDKKEDDKKDKKDKKDDTKKKDHTGFLGFFGGASHGGKQHAHPHSNPTPDTKTPDASTATTPQDKKFGHTSVGPSTPQPQHPQQAIQSQPPVVVDAPNDKAPPDNTPALYPQPAQQGQPQQQQAQTDPTPQQGGQQGADSTQQSSAINTAGSQPAQFIPQRPPPQQGYLGYPAPSGVGLMPQVVPVYPYSHAPPPQQFYGAPPQGFPPQQLYFSPQHPPFPPQGMPPPQMLGFPGLRVGPPPMMYAPPQGMPPPQMQQMHPPPQQQQQQPSPQQLAGQLQKLEVQQKNDTTSSSSPPQVYPGLEIEEDFKIDYSEIEIANEIARYF